MSNSRKNKVETFRFKPDLVTIITSIISSAALIAAIIVSIVEMYFYAYLIMALIAILVLGTLSQSPMSVSVADDFVRINKFFGSKYIYDIKDIKILSKKDFALSIRKFGNGGMFGYWGYYYNRKLGNFKVYATNLNQLAVITTNEGKKYVINYPYDLIDKK